MRMDGDLAVAIWWWLRDFCYMDYKQVAEKCRAWNCGGERCLVYGIYFGVR